MTLGEQIRAAREAKNLSQEELAEALGVSRQAVSKWENGTAVPQGANRKLLARVLGLDGIEAEVPAQKPRTFAWIGWAVAAVLLAALVGMWFYQRAGAPEDPGESMTAEPAFQSIRFYNQKQEEVFPEANWYNTAEIASILIQWTGDTPPETARMFFTPAGTETTEQTELLEIKVPNDGGNALLMSADSLHRDSLMGHLQFELHFAGNHTATSGLYDVIYDSSVTVLAYIESFDGEQLVYDPVEWITFPSDRAEELGVADPGSGFYIYNAQDALERLPVLKTGICTVLNWDANYTPMTVSTIEFLDILEERSDTRVPYHLTIEKNQIVEIQEQYIP